MGNITKTRQPDGSWKQDAQPVRQQPQSNQNQHPDITKVLSQRLALLELVKRIDKLTSAKAIHTEIANLRNAWPTL